MNLIAFIKSLSPAEINIISTAFPQVRKENKLVPETKESELFYSILQSPLTVTDDEILSGLLGRRENDNAYHKLKSRVFLKILEKIASEDFIQNDNFIEHADRIEIRIKKKLLQIKILASKLSKSDNETFFHLLNEVIDESKKNEVYESLLEALYYKKYLTANRSGYTEYKKLDEEIEFYCECLKIKRDANNYFIEYNSNKKLISTFSEANLAKFLNEKVKLLEA
jgi:hypothetical protein